MVFRTNERVRECIECLAELLNPNSFSSVDVDKIMRFLRPANSSSVEHARAVKESIRRAILTHPSSGSDSLIIQDMFDRECLKLDYRLMNSFLALFAPLSYHVDIGKNIINTNGRIKTSGDFSHSAQHSTLNKTSHFMPKVNKSASYSATIQYRDPSDETSDENKQNGNSNDFDEYNALLESNVMWVRKDVELKIITDLIYIFQGVGGKHIRYDARSESYIIDPTLQLSSTVRDTTLCLCELGWLYNRVSEYVNRVAGTAGSVAHHYRGLVTQAFSFAVQEELQDYFRLLAVLEQEAKRTTATLLAEAQSGGGGSGRNTAPIPVIGHSHLAVIGNNNSKKGKSVDLDNSDGGTSGLTLLRLKAWMQEPIDRMCLLARLVDSAGPLTGGALASRLHFYSRHGDAGTNALIQRVMHSVCVPIYTILTRWLLHGELNDPHSEFFIGMHYGSGVGTSGVAYGEVGGAGLSGALNAAVRNIWRDTYYLRPPMLPSFLSSLLAQKVLVIGKSINFIKLCAQKLPKRDTLNFGAEDATAVAMGDGNGGGKGTKKKALTKKYSLRALNKGKRLTTGGRVVDDNDERNDDESDGDGSGDEDGEDETKSGAMVTVGKGEKGGNGSSMVVATTGKLPVRAHDILADITTPEVEAALYALKYGTEVFLAEIVSGISSAIDTRLLRLMESRFHVSVHLAALKKFMLLGQGDFVTCLMDGVGPELKKKATQLFRHNLTGILEGAVRASNAQFEPGYVTDRIGVRLLEARNGDSGWDIFALDYSIDAPLNAIVHGDAMSKYRVAFNMLWRLKRVEWSLAAAWKEHNSFCNNKEVDISRALKVVFHKCTLHRARMMHVVTNLCAFLMFEVLETAWVELTDRVAAATCLDDVIVAHDLYLEEVLDRALLSAPHAQLHDQVRGILDSILKFCLQEEQLMADCLVVSAIKQKERKLSEERSARGEWGAIDLPDQSPASALHPKDKYDGVSVHVIQRLEDTVALYNLQFDALMTTLKEQGEKAGEHLRFLTFRLDFNDYHSLQHSAAAAAGRAPGGVGVSPLTHPTHHYNQQQHPQSGGRHSGNTATAQSTAFPFHDGSRDGGGGGDDGSHISSLPSYRRSGSSGRSVRGGGVPIQLDQDYSPSK